MVVPYACNRARVQVPATRRAESERRKVAAAQRFSGHGKIVAAEMFQIPRDDKGSRTPRCQTSDGLTSSRLRSRGLREARHEEDRRDQRRNPAERDAGPSRRRVGEQSGEQEPDDRTRDAAHEQAARSTVPRTSVGNSSASSVPRARSRRPGQDDRDGRAIQSDRPADEEEHDLRERADPRPIAATGRRPRRSARRPPSRMPKQAGDAVGRRPEHADARVREAALVGEEPVRELRRRRAEHAGEERGGSEQHKPAPVGAVDDLTEPSAPRRPRVRAPRSAGSREAVGGARVRNTIVAPLTANAVRQASSAEIGRAEGGRPTARSPRRTPSPNVVTANARALFGCLLDHGDPRDDEDEFTNARTSSWAPVKTTRLGATAVTRVERGNAGEAIASRRGGPGGRRARSVTSATSTRCG